jgi:hypothetical protein
MHRGPTNVSRKNNVLVIITYIITYSKVFTKKSYFSRFSDKKGGGYSSGPSVAP